MEDHLEFGSLEIFVEGHTEFLCRPLNVCVEGHLEFVWKATWSLWGRKLGVCMEGH